MATAVDRPAAILRFWVDHLIGKCHCVHVLITYKTCFSDISLSAIYLLMNKYFEVCFKGPLGSTFHVACGLEKTRCYFTLKPFLKVFKLLAI